ncbi:MAG: pilus assembly protein PilP [Geobacter sp.]|nr:pilus assembly protein PilP [Geobacter sp.]
MIKKSNIIKTLCLSLACMLLLSACKKEQLPQPASVPPQKSAATAAKSTVVQKAISTASLPVMQVNKFDFSNKKDPFKPFVSEKTNRNNSNEHIKKTQKDELPIHSFDVGKFKLIGIITGGRENRAMVTDPNGKGYVLKVGMTIGNGNGRITSITSSGVDVIEQFTDDNGRVRKENIKITLPRKQ